MEQYARSRYVVICRTAKEPIEPPEEATEKAFLLFLVLGLEQQR